LLYSIAVIAKYGLCLKTKQQWFTLACSKNVCPGGPELMEKAKQIAEKLGKPDFKGS